jgi:hypothetical protein
LENEKLDYIIDRLKHTFSSKRTKITLYVAAVLWVAVGTQVLVNRFFQEELQITEAFVKSNTEEMQSSLEMVADYRTGYLSYADKKKLIYDIADAIGLVVDDDITVWEDDTRSEYFFYKKAKQASSEIKVVSIETKEDTTIQMKHYIIIRLSISQGIQSIDKYKSILEDTLKDLGVKDKQITMKYEGCREGNLTNEQKHDIASLLVDELQGKIALEYDEGDLYTVYAYTGMLNEYVTTLGNKINVQIAITYNELTNKTKITLATPILNESW